MNPPQPVELPSPRGRTPAWLWAVPVFSCCMLGFVPPLVIAAKTKTRRTALWAAGFTIGFLIGFVMIGLQPDNADNFWTNLGAAFVVVTGIGGAAYGVIVGSKLEWGNRADPVTVPAVVPAWPQHDPNPQAIAGVLAARQKRVEARAVAQRDPQMARDLRIGRPDLPRQYDDGGLVDVNSAPAVTIARWLGITEAQAAQIVDARQQLGKFERVDDLLNLVGLDPNVYDQTSERIILL